MYVTLKLENFTISVRNTVCNRKINKLKSISVCSLKREVKVNVTKFCVGREELINAYKHVINGVKENKLKSISACVH